MHCDRINCEFNLNCIYIFKKTTDSTNFKDITTELYNTDINEYQSLNLNFHENSGKSGFTSKLKISISETNKIFYVKM